MPPSTSSTTSGPSSSRSSRDLRPGEVVDERLPAPAGVDGHAQHEVDVAARPATALAPACPGSARRRRGSPPRGPPAARSATCGVASTWSVMPSAPASRERLRPGARGARSSGGRRATAPAAWTCSASASTTSGPIVIGGTKWPSITSTWMTVAPASSTSLDLRAEAGEVGRQDRRRDPGQPRLISARASTRGSGCTRTAPCSTSARSSSARRSWGTPTRSSKRCRQFTQR